ncbi:MAG: PAS domain S-box protein [Desulfobacteraceae bacterium]|nr:PAS domain S-box protein [Desulfobacteraceae bacterium]
MKISIRWTLILGILGLIWGTHLLVATSSYVTSERVLIRHARNIMGNITDLAMEQSKQHLASAQAATILTKRLIFADVVSNDWNRLTALERYFYDQLVIYQHFSGIYLGTPDGGFYDVRRHNGKSEGGFRSKMITAAGTPDRSVQLIWRDENGREIMSEVDDQDSYDPRLRPWYQKAVSEKRIVWTDPYIFYTSQKPGITIAGPVFDAGGKLKGVVGVDIEIDQLSTFLAKLNIGVNGMAFMMNKNGDVIAFPEFEKIKARDGNDSSKIRLVKITELDHVISRRAFASADIQIQKDNVLTLEAPRFARFENDGEIYHAMFTPFTSQDWPWIIGVHLPENDYLGDIKDNRKTNLMVTLTISVIATFVGFWLTGGIIRPLSNLEKESHAIKNNDFLQTHEIRSIYKEIQATSNSFTHMKQAIRSSQERYESIFCNIQDVYFETSIDGTILELSPSVTKITNFSREELLGKSINPFYAKPEDRDTYLEKLIEEGSVENYEIIFKGFGNKPGFYSINSSLVKGDNGSPEKIIGSLRNITKLKNAENELERYRNQLEEQVHQRTAELLKSNADLLREIDRRQFTEKALRNSEEKYRSILESIQEAYFELDPDGRFTFANDATYRIFGLSRDELLGTQHTAFAEGENAEKAKRLMDDIYKTGKQEQIYEFTVVGKGQQKVTLELSLSLIKDSDGNPIGFRGVGRDITARIKIDDEKRKLENELHQSQRMEAIGTLAGGIAHDFNNLLMGIQGNLSLMYLQTDPSESLHENLVTIEKCVESGANLTRQLLGFARGGKYVITLIDLNKVLQNTSSLFGRTKKEIRIHGSYQKDIWAVEADQGQIEQVLVNIYVNAWQAIDETGDLYIESENLILGEKFVEPFDVRPGKYIKISIADTGVGMDKLTKERIFEPFFSTKKMGHGTGLGLASAFGIVKNHSGIITVDSEKGKGSTFRIYLPASKKQLDVTPPETEKTVAGTETLLLIDDELHILNSLEKLLEKLGYSILTAASGRQAIDIFSSNRDRISLVILDMIMPDMGGKEVYEKLKGQDPDIKIILSSGYSINRLADDILSQGCDGFIQKPFNINRLSQKIRDVLDHPY